MALEIIGKSKAVTEMVQLIQKVSAHKSNILIIGESGTGKELVARMLHDFGPLKGLPFVPVNCGAITETLIESELFGHKKGSFTGAHADKPGLFEMANRGTLFLDEVGELPLSMQVKLLRALQDRTIRKVGGTEDIRVDVRIIAATNRDLEAGIQKGTFREDLYYRLNVIQIKTPPLRERRGDITILADHFLKRYCAKQGKKLIGMEPDALERLETYAWPGNVRELENTIERAVTLENGTRVSVASLSPALMVHSVQDFSTGAADGTGEHSRARVTVNSARELRLPFPDYSKGAINLDSVLGEVEKTYLLSALEHTGGVKKKAADLLGITFRSIRYRLKKLGVESGGDDADTSED